MQGLSFPPGFGSQADEFRTVGEVAIIKPAKRMALAELPRVTGHCLKHVQQLLQRCAGLPGIAGDGIRIGIAEAQAVPGAQQQFQKEVAILLRPTQITRLNRPLPQIQGIGPVYTREKSFGQAHDEEDSEGYGPHGGAGAHPDSRKAFRAIIEAAEFFLNQ